MTVACVYRIIVQVDTGGTSGPPDFFELASERPAELGMIPVKFSTFALNFESAVWDDSQQSLLLTTAQSPPLSEAAKFKDLITAAGFKKVTPSAANGKVVLA